MFLVILLNTIEKSQNEIIINKSKFITYIFHINNKNDIETILNNIKNEYPDASHYVYAYVIQLMIKNQVEQLVNLF